MLQNQENPPTLLLTIPEKRKNTPTKKVKSMSHTRKNNLNVSKILLQGRKQKSGEPRKTPVDRHFNIIPPPNLLTCMRQKSEQFHI